MSINEIDKFYRDIDSEQNNDIKCAILISLKSGVCNKKDLKKAVESQDAVIHLAAETGTGQSMYEIEKYNEVNIMGTTHLLQILANSKHSIKKMVIASSRAIYGEGKYCDLENRIQYPGQRLESDMQKGDFNLKCQLNSAELTTLATDENSKIHPSSIYGLNKQQQENMIMLMGKS